MVNKNNKAQALPLNTIVIAMLVIIVLLVIIVFFVGKFSESGETINQNSASVCSDSNPALSVMYNNIGPDNEKQYSPDSTYTCDGGKEEIKVIPRSYNDEKTKVTLCCGTKK